MNNKLKTFIITLLVLILSFLSLNIKVKAETYFKGMYPVKSSYGSKKFKILGVSETQSTDTIGIYYMDSNGVYEQLFCIQPGISLGTTAKYSEYNAISINNYTFKVNNQIFASWYKKDLIRKVLASLDRMNSETIKKGATNSKNNGLNSFVLSDTSLMNTYEYYYAAQGIIWEIMSEERYSLTEEVPQYANKGKDGTVYKSFYSMITSESNLKGIYDKYKKILEEVKVRYYSSGTIGGNNCNFSTSSGDPNNYPKCKLNYQNGVYSIRIVDSKLRYFSDDVIPPEDNDIKVTKSGDTIVIASPKAIPYSKNSLNTVTIYPKNKALSSEPKQEPFVFISDKKQDLINVRDQYIGYNLNVYTDNTTVDEGTYHLRVQKLGGKTFATSPLPGAMFKIYKCPESAWPGQLSCSAFSRTPISSNEFDMISLNDGYAYYENLPSAGKYAVVEVTAPNGYKKSNITNYIDVTKKSDSNEYDKDVFGLDYSFANYEELETPEYTIKIKKVDSQTNKPLAGATFEIRARLSLKASQTVVTDSNGEATITLTPGEYTFDEIVPPNGYSISENSGYSCALCNNEWLCALPCPEEIVFANEPIPEEPDLYQLRFSKTGKYTEDSESYFALEGVAFDLYESDKKTIVSECNIVTDENGIGKCTNISKIGTYYLKEKNPPEGYQKNDKFYQVVVTKDNVAGTSSWAIPDGDNTKEKGLIYNIMIPTAETVYYKASISKYDAINNQKIVGATFNLLDENYKVIEDCRNLVTDTNGIASCSKLTETGIYYFQEISAASGYVVDKSYVPIEIGQSDTVTTGGKKVSFENQPTTGKLIKYTVDENGKRTKLEDGCGTDNYTGPIFEIKDFNGNVLHFTKYKDGEYILSNSSSDSTEIKTCNGEFDVRKLTKGTYTVSEKQAPAGRYYKADDQKITISDTEEVEAVTFVNISVKEDDPTVSIINFKKKNEDGEVLPGGVFVLQRKVNGKYVDVKLDKQEDIYVYTTDESVTNYQMEGGNGDYLITNVPVGEYRIVERQAPDKYQLITDANSKSIITVDDTGKQYYVEMVDKKANVNGSSSSAELIITISTGRKVLNYVLIISGLALVLGLLIIIRKKIKK